MAIRWVALLCLVVPIVVAQVQDSVPGPGSIAQGQGAPINPVNHSQSATEGGSPIADIVFVGGECMQKCARDLGDLNEVADPKNIEKVIKDLDKLCEKFQNAVQCASSCSEEEKESFKRATALLQYTCVEKRDMLQKLGPCMTQHQDTSTKTCEQECGSLDDLIKVGNSTAMPTDPQMIFSKMGPVCNGLKCTIKCMKNDMNERCPGAGDFIRDIAVKQVEEAGSQLSKDVSDPKNPMAEHLAKVLKDTLPADCSYMLEPQQFRDAVDSSSNSTAPQEQGNAPHNPQTIQIDQPIAHPEPAHEGEGTADKSPSGTQDAVQDNRSIHKDPVNPQNASGNIIASTLAVFFGILVASVL